MDGTMKNKVILSGYTRTNNKGIHILNIDKLESVLSNSQFLYGGKSCYSTKIDGIDSLDIDGKLCDSFLIKEESPTFVAYDEEFSQIISISARGNGGVSLYSFDGNFSLKDEYLEMGSSPCHLFFDSSRRVVYSSNYHKGRLDIFYVGKGYLKHLDCLMYEGSSVISPDQDSSRIHMAFMDDAKKRLLVCDLGDDKVYVYDVEDDGMLKENFVFDCESGFGPRHLVQGRDDRFYLLGELSSEIYVLEYCLENGSLKLLAKLSSLPKEYESVKNTAAAIKVSDDNRYLYASNRGADVITIYEILSGGELIYCGFVNTGGKTPRDFGFILDENYVVVGHQNEDYCTVLKRNKENGNLEDVGVKLLFSEIVCVL